VVPATVLLNAIPVVLPEQIDCPEGVAVTLGTGFTVMVTVIGAPGQPDAEGVIVYVAVPVVVPEFVSDWMMLEPEPATAPEMPVPLVAVQLKVVPAVKLVRFTAVLAPEQIVALAGVAVANGTGFTLITTGTPVPGQPLAVGITL